MPVTDDKRRGIRIPHWAYDGKHLIYMQDEGGDENWHIYAVDVAGRTTKILTPFPGVRAAFAGRSRKVPGEIHLTLNRRDKRYPDLFRVDLATGDLKLVAENPGFSGFGDGTTPSLPGLPQSRPPMAARTSSGSKGRRGRPWLQISADDSANTGILNLDSEGGTLFMFDSRGRNTAALTSIDLATGKEQVLAEDPRAWNWAGSSAIPRRT